MQMPGTARIVTVVSAKLSDIASDSYIGQNNKITRR